MQQLVKKNWITIVGIVLGAIGGYIYYQLWGCTNGCPIKSSAWKMTLYGMLMGGLLLNILQGVLQKRKKS
jgi:hypothetical protein